MTSDGWGRGGGSGWDPPDGGTSGQPDSWGTSGTGSYNDGSSSAGESWSRWDDGGSTGGWTPPPQAAAEPRTVSVLPLLFAIASGAAGVVVSFLGSGNNVALPVLGWALCAVLDVLAVAFYQVRHLSAASESMFYRPAAGASVLAGLALLFASVGIVLNSLQIAQWMATR